MKNYEKIILHSDANSFFASVECATNPALKNFPVVVSGNPRKRHGIILAKNNLAKAYGIKTGEAVWQAKQKCPFLICVAPNYSKYEEMSKRLVEIYSRFTDKIEPFGLDECWLDVTYSTALFGNGMQIANKIRELVKSELGITVSIGVSFTKLLAKLGSDLKKPDAITEISKTNFRDKIYDLPANSVVGVGPRIEKRLARLNINTLGELASTDEEIMKKCFGVNGVKLKNELCGNGDDEVCTLNEIEAPKSVGNGITLPKDISTKFDLEKVVRSLSEKVAMRMREQKVKGSVIGLSLKESGTLKTHHAERKLDFPTEDGRDIFYQAMKIADFLWDFDEQIRAVRVRCSGITGSLTAEQISMFEGDKEKKRALHRALPMIVEFDI